MSKTDYEILDKLRDEASTEDWRYLSAKLGNCKTDEQKAKVLKQLMALLESEKIYKEEQQQINLDRNKYNYD
jgi:hypothetical protein